MDFTYRSHRRLPLKPKQEFSALPLHSLVAILDATSQLYLAILADISPRSIRWVRLHPTAALSMRLKRLNLLNEDEALWKSLATEEWVELHPTVPPHYVRLTPSGRVQAQFLAPQTLAGASSRYRQTLEALYPKVLGISGESPFLLATVMSWAQIRFQHPLQWVVIEIIEARTEGKFTIPDQLKLHACFNDYPDALAYLNSFVTAPLMMLAHTSVPTLVLHEDKDALP